MVFCTKYLKIKTHIYDLETKKVGYKKRITLFLFFIFECFLLRNCMIIIVEFLLL
jgi:hypothetical protein